jgi:hypothetical protein
MGTGVVTDGPSRFDSHLAAAESTRPALPVQEAPQTPTPEVAHRVSIDIGEKESRVIVTLHERAGDVSVKVHAASETIKTELQSSVGSLVDSLHRANVSLKNVDFTSDNGTASDSSGKDRNSSQAKAPAGRNRRRAQVQGVSDDTVQLSTIPTPEASS